MNTKDKHIKVCKKCQKEIPNNSMKCPNCKAYQISSIHVVVFVAIIVVIIAIVLLFNNVNSNNSNNNDNNNSNNSSNNENNNSSNENNDHDNNNSTNKIYNFDETFIFDNLEITINSNYSFNVVENRFSDHNNKTAVKLPITIKNISNETHGLNMFQYHIYGSNGTEVETVSSYFDESIDFAGDLRSGASYTKYLYFLYDGDGTYAIEFDNWSNKITVEFNIKKS